MSLLNSLLNNLGSGLSYLGTWNASTNTPTLVSSVGSNGTYYIVSIAGSTNLNGITDWQIGDWAVFNGNVWQKIDQSDTKALWGEITGTLSNQTDLQNAFNAKVNLAGDTMTGNLGFSGNGRKITADMSNATRANRFAFQTSTTNGNTRLGLLPNGTSTLSGVDCYAGTDPDNANFLQVHADGAGPHVGLNSAKTGTGTTRDLVFQIDGTTQGKFNAADGKFNLTTLTASQLTATDASKNFQSLDTATYPSLTEISYVKGVTSAIQTQLNAKVNKAGDTMTGTLAMSGAAINEANFVTVASATTCDIGAAASNNVAISGTTTITSFGTAAAGVTRRCRATGAFLITHNPTSLITANGKNIVTKADDCFTMTSSGSGNWIMTDFKPADGRILANAVNNQTGTTYIFAITDLGNDVTANNASASTYTLPQTSNVAFPIGSKIKLTNLGIGTVTLIKEGSETLLGNTTLLQNVACDIEKISATAWEVSGGTATINMIGIQSSFDITTSATKEVYWVCPSTITLLGIRQIVNGTIGVAGTFAIKKNGTTLSGLGSITPSTTASYTAATGTGSDNVLLRGDVITCVADGTLATVTSLKILLDLTQPL